MQVLSTQARRRRPKDASEVALTKLEQVLGNQLWRSRNAAYTIDHVQGIFTHVNGVQNELTRDGNDGKKG